MMAALVCVMFLDYKNCDKKVVNITRYTDCYIKGYYDGRVAIYGALKQSSLTYKYLDSTFSADSLKFIQNFK